MATESFDILGHIQDSSTMEIFNWHINLPTLHIFGYDLPVTKYVVMLWIVSLLLLLIFVPVARQKSLVPGKFRSLVESILIFIRDQIAIAQIGHDGIHFVPFLATLFFFILFSNALGLIPFGATATASIFVTATLAVISFIAIHGSGLLHYRSVFHYLHAMVPPVPWWLYVPMFLIEIVGHLSRTFALAVRLFANMLAGHIVLLVILGFIFMFKNLLIACVAVGAAVALSCLELFVAVLQAYVFTFLTAVFIGMAVKSSH